MKKWPQFSRIILQHTEDIFNINLNIAVNYGGINSKVFKSISSLDFLTNSFLKKWPKLKIRHSRFKLCRSSETRWKIIRVLSGLINSLSFSKFVKNVLLPFNQKPSRLVQNVITTSIQRLWYPNIVVWTIMTKRSVPAGF